MHFPVICEYNAVVCFATAGFTDSSGPAIGEGAEDDEHTEGFAGVKIRRGSEGASEAEDAIEPVLSGWLTQEQSILKRSSFSKSKLKTKKSSQK